MSPEDLLNKHRITFKYSGNDLVVHCLNPEHDDSNPSMRIDKLTGIFSCPSCGFSGNIFKHFNEVQSLLDVRALRLKSKIDALNKQKLSIPITATYWNKDFRGISKETIKKFYGFTDSTIPNMEDRIIFPIFNGIDEIEFFQGRYIHSELKPKYINYPPKAKKIMFPQFPEIRDNTIYLVEGLFDFLNMYDKGIHNTVCAFGCSLVSKSDVNNSNLKKKFAHYKLQGVSRIIIVFDGDKAGRKGALQLKEALNEHYLIEIENLQDNKDPGSLTKNEVQELRRKYEYCYN